MGGTSIATAVVAGAAAIVRQYLEEGFYPTGRRAASDKLVPSAALIKALLINSARSLSDDGSSKDAPCKTYAKGLVTKNCVPNFQEGFGRPNIANLYKFSKVFCTVALYGKYTRALTYENFVQAAAGRPGGPHEAAVACR
jgi:hypothetical protein